MEPQESTYSYLVRVLWTLSHDVIMEPQDAANWNFLYSIMWCKSFNPERWSLYCYFITYLLQEKQGYPESKKIVKYGVSLVYGKSWGWSSIKKQYHDHQFESILRIPNCNPQLICNIMIINLKSDIRKFKFSSLRTSVLFLSFLWCATGGNHSNKDLAWVVMIP